VGDITNPLPSPSSATTPQANTPPHGLVITNQFPSYTNQPIFTYPIRAKLKLSKFDGNEKQGVAWFNKVEEYFEIHGIYNDDEKIGIVV
jgi:hypothetical protein